MTPEHLKRRGGRRTGYCHCGHRFATEFHDKKNVMWRLPIGKIGSEGAEPAAAVFPIRALPRVPSNSIKESAHSREIRQRMSNDPLFADSILATAELAARAMASSPLETKREEGRNRLKPILEARRVLKPRLLALQEAISDERMEVVATHYTPALEEPVSAMDAQAVIVEASS